jgi:MFS family permease
MFFVYAPIYLTTNGYSNETAGLIISLGVGSMFLASLWGRFGQKYGIRFLLTLGYGLTGIVTILIAVFHDTPTIAVGLIVASAFVAVIIDGAGNVPFLRAVHALERSEMTSVYVTFRHTSQLVTPGIFAIALGMFALPAVFAVGGVACFGMAALARYLPKKL